MPGLYKANLNAYQKTEFNHLYNILISEATKTYFRTKVREHKRKQSGIQKQTLLRQRRLQRRNEAGNI